MPPAGHGQRLGAGYRLRQSEAADEGRESAEHLKFLERRIDEARHLADDGHGVYFGAFIDGRLWSTLGIVADRNGLARFQSVVTHADRRRQGLDGALVYAAALYAVRNLQARTLVIVADPDGPAIGLYRALGFVDTELEVEISRPG